MFPTTLLVSTVCLAWPAVVALEVRRLEKPKYRVLKKLYGKDGKVEVRKYEPYVVAEYDAKDGMDMDGALSRGFRAIAGYIFGRDQLEETKQKIAMTSPVRLEMEGETKHRVSFVMPRKFHAGNLPPCSNEEIKIREVGETTVAVVTFSGSRRSLTPRAIDERKKQILNTLRDNQMEGDEDTVMVYQYHPPFTFGFLRKNEVLLRVKESGS